MSTAQDVRPSKKPKLGFYRPPAPSGAVAASRSSAILDDEYFAKLTLVDVDDDEVFFPDDADDLPEASIVVGKNVVRALSTKGMVEESLRNAIYTDLKTNHSIEFPKSSERWRSEMRLRRTFTADYRYKERDLAHILNEFYCAGEGGDQGTETEVLFAERILSGLNVTTTSLPDMTVLRGESLYFGEFKNSDKYSPDNAAKQCVLYLYALLYFFRVRLGNPVKAVFGFWVCGRDCFGTSGKYAVGLVRLAAPLNLGSPLVPQVLTRFYDTDDVGGIQSLIRFLKTGKIIEPGDADQPVDPSRRIPALLTLPESLWESTLLVANGTASMVFKGNASDIRGLLGQFTPEATIFYPGSFLPSVMSFLDQLADQVSRSFYLKIRLKDTTLREFPGKAIGMIKREANRIYRDLYCVDPAGDANFGIFLMNNRGTVLYKSLEFAKLDFAGFRVLYRTFWTETMTLCSFFLHGDALPHNIVYNEVAVELVLIDLDEGTTGIKAPKRAIVQDDELPYPHLQYPNYFRAWRNRVVYTQLQLVATFVLISPQFESSMAVDEAQLLAGLQTQAAVVDGFLKRHDHVDPSMAHSNMNANVARVISLMKRIIGCAELSLESVESNLR